MKTNELPLRADVTPINQHQDFRRMMQRKHGLKRQPTAGEVLAVGVVLGLMTTAGAILAYTAWGWLA